MSGQRAQLSTRCIRRWWPWLLQDTVVHQERWLFPLRDIRRTVSKGNWHGSLRPWWFPLRFFYGPSIDMGVVSRHSIYTLGKVSPLQKWARDDDWPQSIIPPVSTLACHPLSIITLEGVQLLLQAHWPLRWWGDVGGGHPLPQPIPDPPVISPEGDPPHQPSLSRLGLYNRSSHQSSKTIL